MQLILGISLSLLLTLLELTPNVRIRDFIDLWRMNFWEIQGDFRGISRNSNGKVGGFFSWEFIGKGGIQGISLFFFCRT